MRWRETLRDFAMGCGYLPGGLVADFRAWRERRRVMDQKNPHVLGMSERELRRFRKQVLREMRRADRIFQR